MSRLAHVIRRHDKAKLRHFVIKICFIIYTYSDMTLSKTALSYGTYLVSITNSILAGPMQLLQQNLSLKIENLPGILRVPINFALILLFVAYIIIGYAGDFVCNIVGVFYPLFYGLFLFDEISTDHQNSITMNKYWLLYGMITAIDTFFGFILHLIPGYDYLRLMAIYALVRNNFALTDNAFAIVQNQILDRLYKKSNKLRTEVPIDNSLYFSIRELEPYPELTRPSGEKVSNEEVILSDNNDDLPNTNKKILKTE